MTNITHTIKTTGDSSAKYGDCEICGKHASEVFHMITREEFAPGKFCHIDDDFGHRKCLKRKARRKASILRCKGNVKQREHADRMDKAIDKL